MEIGKLRSLARDARTHPHYHFRELTDAQFLEKAHKSFQKLTEAQRLKVQKSWTQALEGIGEKLNEETGKELLLLRFLAQTNLFFLCQLLEKYSQVSLATHEDICNEFFVQKDPTYASFEQFAKQYTDKKDRMLLVPRGGFKSSIDIADCVQWIICCPEITILILTGVYNLAKDFVGELRQHFELEENNILDPKTQKSGFGPRKMMDKDTGEWTTSLFQVIFPEHCINSNEGTSFEFQTPSGGDMREPTVRAASIEQALSGMHFGVLKLDDVVNNENSQTADRLAKTNKQISINRAMLHPYGFMDVIGTWYDEFDYYGVAIRQEEKEAEEMGFQGAVQGSVDSGRFNSNINMKIYLRAAWWFTEKARKEGRIETEAKKEDYELWFADRLDYEFLLRERKRDEHFPIKYLNNPRQLHKVKIPRELLIRRTIPHSQLPPQGFIVTTVDTAYSVKNWADYTVIMTAMIFGGRFYIINMVRGRFNEFELPAVIAGALYKWKPKRLVIEDSMGVKWMARELRREMDKLQITVPVEFVSLGQGSKRNAKAMKAKPVVRLLGDERMYFSNACEGLDEIYTELEKFTGRPDDGTHDDIISALSLLADQFGAYADMGAKIDLSSTQYVNDKKSAAMHDMIYGLGAYSQYNASQNDSPTTVYQMESMDVPQDADGANYDPLADLM
jgi:phage terminase large subunit-like protein